MRMTAREMDPMYAKMVLRVGLLCTPLHSRELIPNTEAKKLNGRKMIVKMVKIITARDCSVATSVCSRAK